VKQGETTHDDLRFVWRRDKTAERILSRDPVTDRAGYAFAFSACVDLSVAKGRWGWWVRYRSVSRGVTVVASGTAESLEQGKLRAQNACGRIHEAFLPEENEVIP
jgi:hypothetical protein